MRVKEKSKRAGLKLNIKKKKKLRSWDLIPSLHGKQKGKKWQQWWILFPWAPKSLQTVTAAMKLKDTCSLEAKLWQTFVVQLLSSVWLFAIAWTVACQASLSFTISWSLLKLMCIDQWCHLTILYSVVSFSSCLKSFPASWQWVSSLHLVAKILELQLQHQSF